MRSGRHSSSSVALLSSRPSSRVLHSPPRLSIPVRRATIAIAPMSPRAFRLQRVSSSGRLPSRRRARSTRAHNRTVSGRGGFRGRGVGAEASVTTAAVSATAVAEREKAARRLERFRYMAEFAANTVSFACCVRGNCVFEGSEQSEAVEALFFAIGRQMLRWAAFGFAQLVIVHSLSRSLPPSRHLPPIPPVRSMPPFPTPRSRSVSPCSEGECRRKFPSPATCGEATGDADPGEIRAPAAPAWAVAVVLG